MPAQIRWSPPVRWGAAEEPLRHRLLRTGKCYLFLRTIRHERFDAAFQAEVAAACQPRGTAPIPAALQDTGTAIRAKAWTAQNGWRYPKQRFTIDLAAQRVTCPAGQTVPLPHAATPVRFPGAACGTCAQRAACTTTAAGHERSISLHPQEGMLQALRAEMRSPAGRAVLRERTHVAHRLARLDRIRGRRARYTGTRKYTLDARRSAAVANLQECRRLATAA